jgi:hypothetical protein
MSGVGDEIITRKDQRLAAETSPGDLYAFQMMR